MILCVQTPNTGWSFNQGTFENQTWVQADLDIGFINSLDTSGNAEYVKNIIQCSSALDCSEDGSIPCCYSKSGGPHIIKGLPLFLVLSLSLSCSSFFLYLSFFLYFSFSCFILLSLSFFVCFLSSSLFCQVQSQLQLQLD